MGEDFKGKKKNQLQAKRVSESLTFEYLKEDSPYHIHDKITKQESNRILYIRQCSV